MAEVTAALVKELREMTGAGMMECKKALVEVEADLEAAVDVLRTRGLAAAAKKAGRATNEGVVAAVVCDTCGKAGALVEVNCETDFVASNATFGEYVAQIADVVLHQDPADLEALNACTIEDGTTVADLVINAIHTIGENIQVSRFVRVGADPADLDAYHGAVSSYVHGAGRIGILVEFAFEKPETADNDAFKTLAKDLAMQVAAANPVAVSREAVAAETVEHEMSIYKAQAAESGKPENIQEKIATGRLEKYFKEFCLLEQAYIKDPDKTVRAYLEEVSKACGDTITVTNFVRFDLGGN